MAERLPRLTRASSGHQSHAKGKHDPPLTALSLVLASGLLHVSHYPPGPGGTPILVSLGVADAL